MQNARQERKDAVALFLQPAHAACKPCVKTSALTALALPSFVRKREIAPGTFKNETIVNGNRPSFKAAFACTTVATRSQGQILSSKPARCIAAETFISFGRYRGKCVQQLRKFFLILNDVQPSTVHLPYFGLPFEGIELESGCETTSFSPDASSVLEFASFSPSCRRCGEIIAAAGCTSPRVCLLLWLCVDVKGCTGGW